MRVSKLFAKPIKKGKTYESKNATFLINGGFIDQVMAGAYTFLPLGTRVLHKIEKIVREEMDKIGQEIFMPAIVPKQLWEDTNRLEKVDVLFKASGANAGSIAKNDTEYILNSTHEEVVTPLAKQFNVSYRDLPFGLYQIQSKFRNEPRAKSGILRGREFRMKDLYSFHASEEDLQRYYHDEAKQGYIETFKRLGLGEDTVIALASGGDFTEDFSHEFQTRCEAGEDMIFYSKQKDIYYNREVTPSKAPLVDTKEEMKDRKDVHGEGVIGVEDLQKHLGITADKSIKTLIYETDKKEIIAVAVRGDYDVNEEKVRKVLGCKTLTLATPETIKKVTGAEVGYAGILGLPAEVRLLVDEALEHVVNFETGANKTDYHTVNANWGRDIEKPEKFYDLKVAKDGDLDPESGEAYEVFKAAEVGNIFPLNTKFSDAIGYMYTAEDGTAKPVYMGCYGIGTSRVMGVLAEKYNDDKGVIWPIQVAPYHVHLVGIDLQDDEIKAKAEKIYEELAKQGIEVLYDDRVESRAGEKFADADMIGIPVRLVVSKRTGEQVEYKLRAEKESSLLNTDEAYTKIKELLKNI
ncbi:MAG: proline--tRNA ligase [Weeksellaceae bacterium]